MSSIYQALSRQFRSSQSARVMTTALTVVAMLFGLNGCSSYTTAYSHAWRSPNNIHADHTITFMPIA